MRIIVTKKLVSGHPRALFQEIEKSLVYGENSSHFLGMNGTLRRTILAKTVWISGSSSKR